MGYRNSPGEASFSGMGNFLLSSRLEEDQIILSLGGDAGAAQTYDLKTGKLVWRGEPSERGVYLSPTILNFIGEEHLFVAVEGSIIGLDPKNGKTRWKHPWKIFS